MSVHGIIVAHILIVFVIVVLIFILVNLQSKRIIKEKTARLDATLNALPDMLFELDITGKCIDYRAPSPDVEYQRPHSFIGKDIQEILSPDIFKIIKNTMDGALKEGKKIGESFPLTLPHGDLHWYEVSISLKENPIAKKNSFIVLVRDITDRKAAELALKESEERLRFAAKAGNIGIWDYNVKTGKSTILYDNDGLEYPEDFTREDFLKLVYPEDLESVSGQFQDFLVGKRELFDVTCRINVPEAGWQWMLISGLGLDRDHNGNVLKVAGYIRNITGLVVGQQELIEAKTAAEEASQAKSQFIANMSHEIRTPLNAILGLGRMLMNSGVNSRQYDYIQKIKYSAENLLTILNDILDFSKSDTHNPEFEKVQFDIFELVNKTANILYDSIKLKELKLFIKIQEDLPIFYMGDPSRLNQVLLNLLGNAVKFTEKGSISINISLDAETPYNPDMAVLRFTISDTGIGISPEQRIRLFKPFSQGDSSISKVYGGTGLGLVISKNIIEKMGGKIELASQPGLGSTFVFTVRLPVVSGEAAEKPQFADLRTVIDIDDTVLFSHLNRLLKLMGIENVTLPEHRKQNVLLQADFLFYQPVTREDFKYKYILSEGCMEISVGSFENHIQDSLQLVYPFGLNQLYSCITNHKPSLRPVYSSPSKVAPPKTFKDLKILIVDDNEINLMVTEECLKRTGHFISRASSGQEALDRLSSEKFDIILMDLHMPVMDGLEASRRIRELNHDYRPVIIAFTADIDEGLKKKALDGWIDDYVTKPFEPEKLLSVIEKWSHHRAVAPSDSCASNRFQYLPDAMPGLNISEGLERLNGNERAYFRVLALFIKNQSNFILSLKSALDSVDTTAAVQLCHTLKGVSGNIGAVALFEAAATAESLLKNSNALPDSIIIYRLEISLKEVLSSASRLLQIYNSLQATDILNETSALSSTNGDILNSIEILRSLSERTDFEAVDRFMSFLPFFLQSFSEQSLHKLQTAFENMDWETALDTLSLLKSEYEQKQKR